MELNQSKEIAKKLSTETANGRAVVELRKDGYHVCGFTSENEEIVVRFEDGNEVSKFEDGFYC